MNKRLSAALLVFAAVVQTPVFAAPISQYVTGTISGSNTVDGAGLFSPAGTDLNGKPFTIYFQYRPADFVDIGCGAPPGSTCDLRFSKAPKSGGSLANLATPKSVLVQIVVNGVGRSFAPFKRGAVYFFNTPSYPGQLEIFSDDLYDMSNPAPAVELELFYKSTTAFGAQLSPTNNPVNVSNAGGQNSFQIVSQPSGSSSVNETLTFTVTGYTK